MLKRLFYLFIIIILYPLRLLAWGHAGHAMVAELAMSMLSDATRVKVQEALWKTPPAEAGNWMDKVKSNPVYSDMAPWHYTDIEPNGVYTPSPDGDVISILNRVYSALQHVDTMDRAATFQLTMILFHLCGDLLQPLHVGYGSDKGGNTYQVNYNGKGTNLHSVWDSRIIESQKITLSSLQDASNQPSAALTQKLRTQPIDFMAWLKESRELLNHVYDVKGHKLDDAYMQKNKAVVIAQLKDAGFLLANCLEHIFSRIDKLPEIHITYFGPLTLPAKKPAKNKSPVQELQPPLLPAPSLRTRRLPTSAKRSRYAGRYIAPSCSATGLLSSTWGPNIRTTRLRLLLCSTSAAASPTSRRST